MTAPDEKKMFQELKETLVKRDKDNRHFDEYMTDSQCMNQIRSHFDFLIRADILTPQILDEYQKLFSTYNIHHNKDNVSGYILIDGDNVMYNPYRSAYIVAKDSATVYAKEYTTVKAYGSTSIIAEDNAVINAFDVAYVKAFNNCSVYAHNNSNIKASDACSVHAFDSAEVWAEGESEIVTHNSATAAVTDNVKCTAHGFSSVSSDRNATVYAFDIAEVYASENCKIYASGSSTISKDDKSVSIIKLSSSVIIK